MPKAHTAMLGFATLLSSLAIVQVASAEESVSCAQTMARFIPDLDTVLDDSPNRIDRYRSVLRKHFGFPPGYPSIRPVPDCDVEQLTAVAKQSRFFHSTGCSVQYCSIEFRGALAKVYFNLDRNARTLSHADAWWIRPSL
jgi:hypothetical protein